MADELPELDSMTDYLGYFGLDQDPFDAPLFYGGAGRQALLDQIHHLCQFSASLQAVLGVSGTGKTALSETLLSELPESQSCLLRPAILTPCIDVLSDIANCFGIPSSGSSIGELMSEIRHFSQSATEESLAVVLIDDAHQLDDETLAALLSLLQGQENSLRHLHIVMFGLPELIRRLDDLELSGTLINDLYLDEFDAEDLEDYLATRMSECGFIEGIHSNPFTPKVCKTFLQDYGSDLTAIHAEAKKVLIKAAQPAPAKRPLKLPLVHIGAVIALATVLLVALYFPSDKVSQEQGQLKPMALGQEGSRPLPTTAQKTPSAFGSQAKAEASSASDTSPSSGFSASASLEEESPSSESKVKSQNLVDTKSLGTKPLGTKPLDAESLSSTRVKAKADIPSTTAASVDTNSATQLALTTASDNKPTPKPSLAAEVPPAAKKLDALSPHEQQVMDWSGSEYTLQVLGAASKTRMEQFVARQSNRSDLRMVRTLRDGKPWYIVLAGRYPDSKTASRAIASLPATQRESGPWARSARAIHRQISEYHKP